MLSAATAIWILWSCEIFQRYLLGGACLEVPAGQKQKADFRFEGQNLFVLGQETAVFSSSVDLVAMGLHRCLGWRCWCDSGPLAVNNIHCMSPLLFLCMIQGLVP